MRKKILNLFNFLLKHLARATIRRRNPRIIGITGSVGKTSTRTAIYTVLKQAGLNVRAAGGNLNNETGFPLAILGNYNKPGGVLFLSNAILKGFFALFLPNIKYPKILILEYSADKPGDLDYLIDIARPNIAVVTAIGTVPVHVEFYKDVEQVVLEKSKLVEAVSPGGTIVLNLDDPDVVQMKGRSGVRTKTYGFDANADVQLSNFKNLTKDNIPLGASFNIRISGESVGTVIEGALGKSQAYSSGAAIAVGSIVGLTLGEMKRALSKYRGEKGRGRIIEGIKNTYIIDDTYNASPKSTQNALETLKDISAKRKVAVLGDMLELGEYSQKSHQNLAELVVSAVDILITIGKDSRLIGEQAKEKGLSPENIFHFERSLEAIDKLKEILREEDVILVKGSQSIRTEKLVKAIMKNPQEAKSLLVRQYGKWLKS